MLFDLLGNWLRVVSLQESTSMKNKIRKISLFEFKSGSINYFCQVNFLLCLFFVVYSLTFEEKVTYCLSLLPSFLLGCPVPPFSKFSIERLMHALHVGGFSRTAEMGFPLSSTHAQFIEYVIIAVVTTAVLYFARCLMY